MAPKQPGVGVCAHRLAGNRGLRPFFRIIANNKYGNEYFLVLSTIFPLAFEGRIIVNAKIISVTGKINYNYIS